MAGSRKRSDTVDALFRELQRMGTETSLVNQALAERLGLNPTDFQVRSILELEGPLTAGRIAEITGLTTGAVTGVLDRLEKLRLVERATDPEDRRRVIIRPLPGLGRTDIFGDLSVPLAEAIATLDESRIETVLEFVRHANAGLVKARSRLRSPAEKGAEAEGEFSAPLGRLKQARLEFAHGAAHVRIDGDPSLGDLFRARFEGPQPTIDVEGDTVLVRYRRPSLVDFAKWAIRGSKQESRLTLNASIPWDIEMRAGLARFFADLTKVHLTGLGITGGASDVEVMLPEPREVVQIRVSGGASNVTLHRPKGVPARIQLTGGASGLRFDGQHLGSVGGEVSLETPGARNASPRYDIRLTGGASSFVVDAR